MPDSTTDLTPPGNPGPTALPENCIDWYIDPKSRVVTVDPAYGAFPLHLKQEDDFLWRIHFRVGGFAGTAAPLQLSNLEELRFLMLEKGRYGGTPLAVGASDLEWDEGGQCYHLTLSLNASALKNYLATLDATTTGFGAGGFDCKAAAAAAAGTTTTITKAGAGDDTTTTETTAPGKVQPATLVDYEFMCEFRWIQRGQQMRSQTFPLWIARDLITSAAQSVVILPPALPTDWRFLCALVSEGTPYPGEVFGYVKAPLQMEVLGLQVALQQPDPGQGFRIQLTDRTGAALGNGAQFFGDLPPNTAFATLLFGQVLAMNQGDEVRAAILNYAGDSAAGLAVNLICRQYVTYSPAGPSGPPGITSATATTLPPGTPATASVVGQVLKLGLPAGRKGDDGTSVTRVTITPLGIGAPPTASLDGSTLQLGLPAPAPGAPGNPGQGVIVAQVTPLLAGSQPTAGIVNGTLFLGLPAGTKGDKGDVGPKPFETVAATTVSPNTPASAEIVNAVLRLGIPAGATGSYLHVSDPVGAVAYDATHTAITTCTFTGVAKKAIVLLAFRNRDDVTKDQTDIRWNVTRSDRPGSFVLSSGVTLPHPGNTYPVMDMAVDPQTAPASQGPVTYTLNVSAFSGGLPGNPTSQPAAGHIGTPLLVILEITN